MKKNVAVVSKTVLLTIRTKEVSQKFSVSVESVKRFLFRVSLHTIY